MYAYPVIMNLENGQPRISCIDVPGMACVGETPEQAMADAVVALEMALSLYVLQRMAIPLPSPCPAGQKLVRLPALSVAKVALWNAMLRQRVSKAELARRLGVNRPQVDRLVNLLHRSKIEKVEQALRVLGWRIELTVVKNAV
ncbi:type II toxin-antitoxin system HicB family antitoxin [Pseudomonas sp. MSSRFD41]|uniref:type II toxin-antitoxin system HicB family antitoxin n=1 Tax=unclassified Pseudomonas TaxID=196821 RepID=UPI00163A25B9|nr:type II toxin-antitoxin system HicB family antitoxin [Pseudomonas sp. MSSRFD41]MBC2659595.1 type II toxin-antitoxin system HicB family antitoxin [Pseudomonas sp. MSSRFD41]